MIQYEQVLLNYNISPKKPEIKDLEIKKSRDGPKEKEG